MIHDDIYLNVDIANVDVVFSKFKFNAPMLDISEEGNLSSQLSILKVGQNKQDIAFKVTVISGSAHNKSGTVTVKVT